MQDKKAVVSVHCIHVGGEAPEVSQLQVTPGSARLGKVNIRHRCSILTFQDPGMSGPSPK